MPSPRELHSQPSVYLPEDPEGFSMHLKPGEMKFTTVGVQGKFKYRKEEKVDLC